MVLGPVGAAVGAMLGHQYDLAAARREAKPLGEQFFHSTFVVMGHVAKADGRVSEREIDSARQVMRSLGLSRAQMLLAIELFTKGKQADFDLAAELADLKLVCQPYPETLGLFLEVQLRFALGGGDMSGAARSRVEAAAFGLGVSAANFARFEAAMRGASQGSQQAQQGTAAARAARLEQAYRSLEVDVTVSDADLIKSYRRLMSRNHPDKLKANGLPDSMLEHAKQRTQVIREAYELLREHRGFG